MRLCRENLSSGICRQLRPRSDKLTESLDTTERTNGEQRPRWYFAHAQDDLNVHTLRMLQDTFSLDVVQTLFILETLQ